MKAVVALLAIALASCGEQPQEATDADIANRAESLERAADATTDQLIAEIEAQTKAETAAETAPPAGNSAE